ncbi:MAG: sodium/solute symporter [Verrucomicrobiota bacterium]|nr:sodium/solute symporter [Verrucomicrobiota bacterium]MDP6752727.1 sodium/solute symporter [Verrucomicrobiota bacterium]
MNIHWIDATLLCAYLMGMVVFGMWMGRGTRSSAEFMVGGRSMPWWAVLCSIVATETSTITFLSVPGLAYTGDLAFLQLPLGYILGRWIVSSILLPRYFSGELFTAYEVLDRHFGSIVKRVASLLFIVTRTLGDGFRLFLGAIVLQHVADIDMNTAIIALGIATIIYTFAGGIRAVIWTDFIQFVVYMVGAAIAFWILLGSIEGGWGRVADLARAAADGDKLRIFHFDFDLTVNYLFWAGLIGGGVLAIGTHGVDQLMVQRYLSARSQGEAALALRLSGFVVLLQFAFFLLIGTALYAYYTQNPPPEPFAKSDRVFATFIVDNMPVGVLGIVLGALFSAAMSTLSSSLNSSATVLVNDILKPDSDRARLRLAKWLTIAFGVAQIVVGISGQWLDSSVIGSVLAIQGFTTGIILGVFALGLAKGKVSTNSALVGLVVGLIVMTAIKFGTPLAWPWFALVGSTVTFCTGVLHNTLFNTQFRPGLEVCAANPPGILRGARFGLVMNQASVDSQFRTADAVLDKTLPGQLAALFGPQHGLWSEQQDNMIETPHGLDSLRKIPVHSLYADVRKPTPEMLEALDVLVIDLQDVGTRVYTYLWTLHLCLEAAAENGIVVVVLDRPNPLGGEIIEGPMLEPGFASFVGRVSMPMRHGLTLAEAARHLNRVCGIGANLHCVPMEGYRRGSYWPEHGRPWIPPSPNLPRLEGVLLYPGQVLLEGTMLSEGRGTTTPFELCGAPYIDPAVLLNELEEFGFDGLTARPYRFEPAFQKFAQQSCGGLFLHPTNPQTLRSYRFTVAMIGCIARLWPKQFAWRQPPYEYETEKMPIDILSGGTALREAIDAGLTPESLERVTAIDNSQWERSILPDRLYE